VAEKLRRHDLVWIEPSVWATTIAGADEPLLRDWALSEWPLVVRRPIWADESGLVPVGLPLPPHAGKKRLAFAFPAAAIRRVAPPPLLSDADDVLGKRLDTVVSVRRDAFLAGHVDA
jgi:phosphoribosyl-dephospho-CoA transferase